MIRFRTLAVLGAVLSAPLASPIFAQDRSRDEYRGTPEQQAACTPDVFKLCSPEIPDVPRITTCLRTNFKKLSPDCAAVFAEKRR
jgi:hypothetical protein